MNSKFLGYLDARHLEGKWWKLKDNFGFYSAKYDVTVFAPKGFVTDFSSVPRWPIAYWLTGGTGNQESVPHDLLYRWFKKRFMADMLFFESGRVRSKLRTNQKLIYRIGRLIRTSAMTLMVVIFGWIVKRTIPGCLDYRTKCKKDCETCENYYKDWQKCLTKGYNPELLKDL